MTSFHCVGPVLSSSNYGLLTKVLRNEYGFQGMVLTDYGGPCNDEAMVRSGNDAFLSNHPTTKIELIDFESETGKNAILKVIKNISYTVLNSNAFIKVASCSSVYTNTSPWKIGVYTGSAILGAISLVAIGFATYWIFDKKKNPSKYRSEVTDSNK